MRVVAVESDPTDAPVEAILWNEEKPGGNLLRWWGGRAWETLMLSDVETLLADNSTYRRFELDLPEDWQEGYLEPNGSSARFVVGDQPKRGDWEEKRWSRRLRARFGRSSRG